MTLLITALLWNIIHILVVLFPHYYASELIISFLPYSITGHFLVVLVVLLWWTWRPSNRKQTIAVFLISLSTLCLGWYQYNDYQSIYKLPTPTITTENTSQNISFLYANIYYKNNNFSWLLTTIQQINPDIILFVEYAKIHDDALKTILSQEYPYRNRSIGAKHFDGDVIYSRYPLSKIEHDIPAGSWSFSHVEIEKNDRKFDIALIHTSAPVSNGFFAMREQQMDKLYDILSQYYIWDTLTKRDLIVLWDFNVSPWSPDYTKFDKEMKGLHLHDITTDLSKTDYKTPFPYTRCHQSIGIACSHIDHIRSNRSNLTLQRIDIPGSDHDGFIGKR